MSSTPETRFLVDPDSDPVAIRVEGKASFQNCTCVKDFLERSIAAGNHRFVMDFEACTGMDSTFLGLLAGTSIQLRKTKPRGSLVVCNLNERNIELVKNLGLSRLLTLDEGSAAAPSPGQSSTAALDCEPMSDEVAAARLVLEMHRNLVEADEGNAAKFQDVIDLLRRQLGEE